MIGMGKNGTETNEILNFANVYPLPIDECIQKMYNFKNPWTSLKTYNHDNAICIHGKKCRVLFRYLPHVIYVPFFLG